LAATFRFSDEYFLALVNWKEEGFTPFDFPQQPSGIRSRTFVGCHAEVKSFGQGT
jgi:hypothetical protein